MKMQNVMLGKRRFITRFGKDGSLLTAAIVGFAANLVVGTPILGMIAAGAWFVYLYGLCVRWGMFGKSIFERLVFGGIFVCSTIIFFLLVGYFLFGLSFAIVLLIFCVSNILFYLLPRDDVVRIELSRVIDIGAIWLFLSVFADVLILILLVMARTDEAVISPWSLFSGELFLLFFGSTLLFFFGAMRRDDDAGIFVAVFHLFTALSVSVIVYGVGFGFDPFVHRAAEVALVEQGSIEPKTILYSGQYVFVAALHQLTAFGVKVIDVWLVPLLAALALPIGGYIGLREGWGFTRKESQVAWVALLLIPFSLITFTVPFSVTYVFFLMLLLLLPAAKSGCQKLTLMFGAAVGITFHPLLAVSLLLLILGFTAFQVARGIVARGFVLIFSACVTAIATPALFVYYQISKGEDILFGDILDRLKYFFFLFHTPYVNRYPFIPWALDFIYDLRYLLPMIFAVIAVVVMMIFAKRIPEIVFPYAAFMIGLMGSIFGVRTLFYFKDIIHHEQAEFALRLLQSWFMIPLPFIGLLLVYLARKHTMLRNSMFVLMSLLFTHAWFFSYPQFNLKYPYFSPSVSDADVEAVQLMQSLNPDVPYLVLSNQMTSAAALQEIGFAHYYPLGNEEVLWYAIPTGGPLYQYYTAFIHGGVNPELLEELSRETGARRIYYVTHGYWNWGDQFLKDLEATSDRQFSLQGDDIRIFEYEFNFSQQ